MQFKDITGQEAVKAKLIRTVQNERVSHAQLFIGPSGCGKLAMALAYAQYVNCEAPSPSDSCGTCPSCIKSSKLIHPDLHYTFPVVTKKSGDTPVSNDYLVEWREAMDQNPYLNVNQWLERIGAENKQGNITVKECHGIIRSLNLKTYESPYKVQIIWLPEYLKEAGNVLLKIIEEPPEKTLFILVAENQDQILNTILSRTQLLRINRLADKDIADYLINTKGTAPEQATRVANLADGDLNEALILLEESENDNEAMFREWLNVCVTNKGVAIVKWVDKLSKTGREQQKQYLRYVLHFMREMLLLPIGQVVRLNEKEKAMAEKLYNMMNFEGVSATIEMIEKGHYSVERNANPKILFLNLSIRLAKILQHKKVNLTV